MIPVGIGGTFGWFGPGRTRRGVVLCGTLGFEQHVAHRWWRDLGAGLADAGCAVLRFDYPGEGDSDGIAAGLDTALDAIRRGIRYLREEAGAEEIVLVGLRLGGTLAAMVAGEGGVDRLVLLAPFARGRAYLREMEVQARVVNIVPDGSPLPQRPGVLAVGGFVLSPDLIRDLAPIDLRSADRPPAPRILLLGPDPADLAARYAALGARVETGDLPGLSALVTDAELARMAAEPRARILAFAGEGASPEPVRSWRGRPGRQSITGTGWREEPVRFADGLFGIRCRPGRAMPRTPAVLFVNMGANVHSGYGRQTTALARTLARSGIPSLRMDLRGVGDSDGRPDGTLPFYRLDAVADLRAAVDQLAGAEGRPVIAVGTCNGAYLAFHALCQDRRICSALLINLYCFDWGLTHGGTPYGASPVRHTATYAAMLTDRATWRRILTGRTPVAAIAGTLVRRGLSRLAKVAGRGPRERAAPIAARIADLRRRHTRLVLLYSAGDLGLVDLRTQLGSLERAGDLLGEPVRIVAKADHSFSAEAAQTLLVSEIHRLAALSMADLRPAAEAPASVTDRMAPTLHMA